MFLDFLKVIVFALCIEAHLSLYFSRSGFLCVDAVSNLILLSNSFRSSAKMRELRAKSFSASKLVLYPPLIGPPRIFTSLLIVTSVTKSNGIVEKFLPLKLAPIP